MTTRDIPATTARTMNLLAMVMIVGVLYFGQEVLIPMAMAILLSFLLAPVVVRLRKHGVPRVPAVVLTVGVTTIVASAIAWTVANQLLNVVDDLPNYHDNIQAKIQSFTPSNGDAADADSGNQGLIQRATTLFDRLSAEFDSAEVMSGEEPKLGGERQGAKPMLVEVYNPNPSPFRVIFNMLSPILEPAGQAGIVFVFVIFILLQREDLRDRMIRLLGGNNLNVTTQAINDAGYRVSRYLLMQLVVNLTYGIPVGVGLWLIGVPAPLLWGVLATLLRFIPYVGPIIAGSFPTLLSLAVDPGWSSFMMTAALFVVLELVSNNIMEPLLYGSSTGITPVAILVAAVFWTWLWGPIGLILSTPMTVCLMVLGKYWPQLEFLTILLGDEPGLSPEARYYQRLLALDGDTSTEIAEEYLDEYSLQETFENVLLRGLSLAEEDRHRGKLDELHQNFIVHQTREIVESLEEPVREEKGAKKGDVKPETLEETVSLPLPQQDVLCLPARDVADELAGLMLARLVEPHRLKMEVLSATMLAGEFMSAIADREVKIVCISALPPFATMHARYLTKRVRNRYPDAQIIVCIWNPKLDMKKLCDRLAAAKPDGVATTLDLAVAKLRAASASIVPEPTSSQ